MTTSAKTQTATTLVAAELAPIGRLLWPVRDERYAPNFTLAAIETIRTAETTRVRWVYEGEAAADRYFDLGERVVVAASAVTA